MAKNVRFYHLSNHECNLRHNKHASHLIVQNLFDTNRETAPPHSINSQQETMHVNNVFNINLTANHIHTTNGKNETMNSIFSESNKDVWDHQLSIEWG